MLVGDQARERAPGANPGEDEFLAFVEHYRVTAQRLTDAEADRLAAILDE